MRKTTLLIASVFSVVGALNAQTLYYTESSTGLSTIKWEKGNSVIKMADLNNDGNLDIVTVGDHGAPTFGGATLDGVVVFFGDGAGNWTAKKSGGKFGYGGVAVGDVNNDGKMDVGYGIHHNWAAQGTGNPDFGDQIMEVALGNGSSNPSWTPYDNGLASNGETYGMFACDFGDIDNDGLLDFGAMSFGAGNGVQIYKNNGDGTWTWSDGLAGGNVTSVDFLMPDINNDGYADVFAGWDVSKVSLGDGSGVFNTSEDSKLLLGPYEWWTGFSYGDIDGNGTLDLVVCSDSVGPRVLCYDPKIAGANKWKELSGNLPKSIGYTKSAVADMNKDGFKDLVLFGGAGIDIFLGDGAGNWTQDYTVSTAGAECNGLAVGDINHDGYPDIAAVTFAGTNTLQVFKYTGQAPTTLEIQPTLPNPGKCFKPGTVTSIDWVGTVPTGTGTVKLEFSSNGPNGTYSTIAIGLANNGHYQWTVPSSVNSADCYIKYTISNGTNTATAMSPLFGVGAACFASVGVPDVPVNEGGVSLFPNPTRNTATVNLYGVGTQNSIIAVYDVVGKEVLRSNAAVASQFTIDLSNQGTGVYFVKIFKTNGETLVKKLVVQ